MSFRLQKDKKTDRFGININFGGNCHGPHNGWGIHGSYPAGPMPGVGLNPGATYHDQTPVYDNFGHRPIGTFTGWITEMPQTGSFVQNDRAFQVNGTFRLQPRFGSGFEVSQANTMVTLGFIDKDKAPAYWLHKAVSRDFGF